MLRDRAALLYFGRAALICASLVAMCALTRGCATGSTTELPDQALSVISRNVSPTFSGAPQRGPASTGNSDLVDVVMAASRDETRARLVHDPRLDVVAESCAEIYARRKAWPSPQTMRWLMWRVGVVSRGHEARFSRISGKRKTSRANERLREDAARMKTDGETLLFGVARVSFGSKLSQSLVWARRPLQLDALPKRHQPGAQISLAGALEQGHGKLLLGLNRDLGKVQLDDLALDGGGRFEHTITLPETPGTYFAELRASTPGDTGQQRRQVAMFPIYVGVEEPEVFDLETPLPQLPESMEAWQRMVVQVYNDERARFSLPPLQVEPALRDFTMREAERLRAGHKLRSLGEASAELEKTGVEYGHYQWSGGTEAKLQVFLWQNMYTPAIRSILLDPTPPVFAVAFAPARDQSKGFHYVQLIGKQRLAEDPEEGDQGATSHLSARALELINQAAEPTLVSVREGPPDEQTQRLVQGLLDAVDEKARQGLRHDPGLDAVAAVTARTYGEDKHWPGRRTMRWLFAKSGSSAGYEVSHFRRSSGKDRVARLDRHLVEVARELKTSKVPRVFGVARLGVGDYVAQAIVIGRLRVQLEPVAKKQRAGDSFSVRGVVAPVYHDAIAMLDRGGGEVESRSLKTDEQGRFEISFTAPEAPGTYHLSLRARDQDSDRLAWSLLVLLPIYVETEEPLAFSPAKRWQPLPAEDPSTWGSFVTKVLDQERAEAGLPPLQTPSFLQAFVDEQARKLREGKRAASRPEVYALLEQQGLQVGEYDYLSTGTYSGVDMVVSDLATLPHFRRALFHQKETIFAVSFVRAKDEKFGYRQVLYIGDLRATGAVPRQ